jgi:hypothetical protein
MTAEAVIVIGVGNVAVDDARVLSKTADELRTTDIPDHVLAVLSHSRVRDVMIIGRRGPAYTKFTTKELRELGELANAGVVMQPEDLALDEAGEAELARNPVARRNLEVLRRWSERTPEGRPRRSHLRFWLRPTAICGDACVIGMEFARGRPDGAEGAADTGESVHLRADMVLRSAGYRGVQIPGLPFDDERGVIPNAAGRILRDGAAAPGEYVAGWIKRGPSGIIGTNKHDANETVRCLREDAPTLPGARSATPMGSSTSFTSAACESSCGRAGKRLKPLRSRPGDDVVPSRSRWQNASYFSRRRCHSPASRSRDRYRFSYLPDLGLVRVVAGARGLVFAVSRPVYRCTACQLGWPARSRMPRQTSLDSGRGRVRRNVRTRHRQQTAVNSTT